MVVDFEILFDKFLGSAISAEQFQSEYLDLFKSESRRLGGDLFALLDELFGDLDSLSDDRQLLASRPAFYLDETALRAKVQSAAIRMAVLGHREGREQAGRFSL